MLSVSLLTLGSPEQLTGGYLYNRRMADLAPANDSELRFVSFAPQSFPLAVFQADPVMRKTCESNPDVVLIDSIVAACLALWLPTHRFPIPLAAILHQQPGGIDHEGLRRRIQVPLDIATYRHVSLLMLASQALMSTLPRGLCSDREILVVPPGRDVATEVADVGDLRKGRRAAFLCVANWVQRKGISELLEAFASLPRGSATLHLVGRDDIEPGYTSLVRERLARPDLQDRVIVHGPVDRATVSGMYRCSDAFVLASTKEPYGTVYGEAMAASLPVVGWRAGNLPHLAEHEREALIIEPGDITGLSTALQRLSEDEELRARLGEAARHRAQSLPTWEESARSLFGALRRLPRGTVT
jgi:glycosyltransferase involved in cell wall biosynthesis